MHGVSIIISTDNMRLTRATISEMRRMNRLVAAAVSIMGGRSGEGLIISEWSLIMVHNKVQRRSYENHSFPI